MTDKPTRPVFLERSGYRRRRLADAAFLLPVFGTILFAAPVLWPVPADPDAAAAAVSTSSAIQYLFGAWLGLIVAACVFGLTLKHRAPGADEDRTGRSPATGREPELRSGRS